MLIVRLIRGGEWEILLKSILERPAGHIVIGKKISTLRKCPQAPG